MFISWLQFSAELETLHRASFSSTNSTLSLRTEVEAVTRAALWIGRDYSVLSYLFFPLLFGTSPILCPTPFIHFGPRPDMRIKLFFSWIVANKKMELVKCC